MKKILIGLAGLVVLIIAAALIVPSLIDWNSYKTEIAAEVEKATGRKLTITGDLELAILPSPSFSAAGIVFANHEGGSDPAMVSLEQVTVEVALFPLIGGNIQVDSIVLTKPVILLEQLADGRTNWSLEPPAGATTEAAAADDGGLPALSLASLSIVDGVVIWRDAAAGSEERVEDLDAEISAGSLQGPFTLKGSAQVRGLPTTLDIGVGALNQSGPPPFKVTLGLPDSGAELTVDGRVVLEGATPGFVGRVSAKGGNLAGALQQVTGAEGLPPLLGQAFELATAVTLDDTAFRAEDLTLALGPSRGSGSIAYLLGEAPSLEASLAFPQLDLDALMAQATAPDDAAPSATAEPAAEAPATLLPPGLTGSFEVTVQALLYRGQAIQNVTLAADIADDVVTLRDIAMLLPGPSRLELSGKVALAEGEPTFAGEVSLASDQLRGLLTWLGADVAAVPSDRLGRFVFKSKVTASGSQLDLADLTVSLDSTTMSGGAAIALGDRPGLGLGLAIDELNLDAYLPPAAAGEGGGGEGGPGADPLQAFDANLDLRIGRLTYQDTQVGDIRIEGTLQNGVLTFKQARLGQVAGGSLAYVGSIAPAGPTLDGTLELTASDPERLARLAGLDPATLAPLGPFELSATLKGTPAAMDFNGRLGARGGSFTAAGRYVASGGEPMALTVTARHPDLGSLAEAMGQAGVVPTGFGGIDAAAKITLAEGSVSVADLKGQVGPLAIERANVTAALAGERPNITLDAVTGVIDLTAFGGNGGGAGSGGSGERWSSEPLGLEGLRDFDATATIAAAALVEGETRIDDARLDLTLQNGVLTLREVSGVVHGGRLQATGSVDVRATPILAASFSLSDLDLAQVLAGVFPVGEPVGRATAQGQLASSGASMAALVAALDGAVEAGGSFNLKTGGLGLLGGEGLSLGGKVLEGLLGDEAAGLGRVQNVTDGAALLIKALADHDSPFIARIAIANGHATLEQVQVNGRGLTAKAEGFADLAPFTGDILLSVFLNDRPDQPYYRERRIGLLDDPAEVTRDGLLLSGEAPEELPEAAAPSIVEELVPGVIPPELQGLIPGTDAVPAIPGLTETIDSLTGGTEEPAAEEPATEEPATPEATTDEPAPEEAAAEEPATEEPAAEEPAAEEPAAEEPAAEEPAAVEPAAEEPAAEEPAAEEPAAEEPAAEESAAEEPAAEEPAEEPAAEQPAAEQPAAEEPAAEEPAAEAPAAAEPASEAAPAEEKAPAEVSPSEGSNSEAPAAEPAAEAEPTVETTPEAAGEAVEEAVEGAVEEEQPAADSAPADAPAAAAAEAVEEAVEEAGEAAGEGSAPAENVAPTEAPPATEAEEEEKTE